MRERQDDECLHSVHGVSDSALGPYDEWDAASVLGTFSAADRAEYEDHLADCPRCSAAMTVFAALPGLLGVLPDADRLALLDESRRGGAAVPSSAGTGAGVGFSPEADVLPLLASRVQRRRPARRIWAGVVAAAVAAAVMSAVLLRACSPPLVVRVHRLHAPSPRSSP
jgi:anti-sigma factor RsiW